MPALTTSDLACYVELTVREIYRAVFRLRAVGIIAELPDKIEFNGVLIPVDYPEGGPLESGTFTNPTGVNALPQSTTQSQSASAPGQEVQTTTGTDTQNATQLNLELGQSIRNTWNTYDEV